VAFLPLPLLPILIEMVIWKSFAGYYGGPGPWNIHILKSSAGVYTDVTSAVLQGAYTMTPECWNPTWVDVNNDGYLDLWIPSFRTTNMTGQLFINDKKRTPRFILQCILKGGMRHRYIQHGEIFNNDGFMDLVVESNGDTTNYIRLFQNNGDGTFTNVTPSNFPTSGVSRNMLG